MLWQSLRRQSIDTSFWFYSCITIILNIVLILIMPYPTPNIDSWSLGSTFLPSSPCSLPLLIDSVVITVSYSATAMGYVWLWLITLQLSFLLQLRFAVVLAIIVILILPLFFGSVATTANYSTMVMCDCGWSHYGCHSYFSVVCCYTCDCRWFWFCYHWSVLLQLQWVTLRWVLYDCGWLHCGCCSCYNCGLLL